MEKEVRNEPMDSSGSGIGMHIYVALLVVFISILVYILKKRLTRGNTVLIVGLCDSGKTVLFSKLINPSHNPETYTSLKENRCEGVAVTGDKAFTLIDFPGSERLRKHLFGNYLQKNRSILKGIIFVIDSLTFSKKARDVAAFLYDVLYESDKKVPILIACNKQDCPLAKSSQAVRTALEREFGFINATREAALDSTDGATKKRTLTSTGKNFQWDDLSSLRLDFIECFARKEEENRDDDGGDKECEIGAIRTWVVTL